MPRSVSRLGIRDHSRKVGEPGGTGNVGLGPVAEPDGLLLDEPTNHLA